MMRPGAPVEWKELHNNNGKLELTHSPSEQETKMSKSDDEPNLGNGLHQREWEDVKDSQRITLCCIDGEARPTKKLCNTTIITIALALSVSILLNIIQFVLFLTKSASPCIIQCPQNWIMIGNKCYFYSDKQASWDFSQRNCSYYGGSLVTIESEQEWASVTQCRRPAEYWINLRREEEEESWKWPDGSLVDSWFQIKGKGFCGYLNEKEASSTL